MKVFKMNEVDWVCAHSEKEAKTYYQEYNGESAEDIEEAFEGEVSLDTTMYIEVDMLSDREKAMMQQMKELNGIMHVKKPFSWVIEKQKKTQPYVIATNDI